MARRKQSRIYGKSGHPMMEALPLGVAFVVGVGGEIFLKLTPGMPVLTPAIFAILVLCAYALYAYFATELRMDAETIGDNCYYLGFLFTLTALAVTLFFIVEGGGGGDAIPEIISGFGVALSSTIAGVFLRVLMMQFKVDVESRERRERLELNEASRRFRTELSMSIDQIKTFSVESVQRNVEREAHMQKAFDQLLSDMQQELLKSAEEFGPALRESVSQQTQSSLAMVTAAVHESSALAASAIGRAMSEMTTIATDLAGQNTEAADRIRQSVALLLGAAENLSQGSADTMARLAQTQETAGTLTEAFAREVNEGTDGMTKAMKNARQRLENGAQSFSDVTTRAGALLGEGIGKIAQSFDATSRLVDAEGEKLARRMSTDAQGFFDATIRVSAIMEDSAAKVGQSFDATIKGLGEANERLKAGSQSFAQEADRATKSLEEGVGKIGRSFDETSKLMADAGEQMAQRIDVDLQSFSSATNRASALVEEKVGKVGLTFDLTLRAVSEAGDRLQAGAQNFSLVTRNASTALEDGAGKVGRVFDLTAKTVGDAAERLANRIDQAR